MSKISQIRKLTIDHSAPVEDRIALARRSLPWIIGVHPLVISHHREDSREHYLHGKKEYLYRLFQFPEGTSHEHILAHLRKWKWMPANPVHMLAFAAGGFKDMPSFPPGVWANYVVGLGGTLHTVLGEMFGGLGTGTTFFFQHVPQDKLVHQGGIKTRFLAVKENWQ